MGLGSYRYVLTVPEVDNQLVRRLIESTERMEYPYSRAGVALATADRNDDVGDTAPCGAAPARIPHVPGGLPVVPRYDDTDAISSDSLDGLQGFESGAGTVFRVASESSELRKGIDHQEHGADPFALLSRGFNYLSPRSANRVVVAKDMEIFTV